MIFVLEKLASDRRARIEAWERKRDKYLVDHDYYSEGSYERTHPRPGQWMKYALNVSIGLAIAAVLAGLMFLMLTGGDNNQKHNDKKAKAVAAEQKSAVYHVGDKVQVVYGDYEDSVGVIIRLTDSDAIIKLTNSTLTHAMCNASSSCSSGGGHDNGELLGVGSLSNLVPYKEVK